MDNTEFENKYKRKLHDTFKFAIDFFQAQNLSWFCAFGTAIGAVRHNDIIPWDDDIDIFMPRKDYDRLLSLKNEFIGTLYSVVSHHDTDYCFPFAKIMDDNSTIWEAPRYPFVLGVYIDIFPLDYSDLSGEKYLSTVRALTKSANRMIKCQTRYSWDELKYDLKKNYKGAILSGVQSLFYPSCLLNKAKKDFIEKERLFYNENGSYCLSFSGYYGTKEVYKREWFDGYIEFPFHDYKVRIPKGYDNYLSQVYGDYMKLPPECKRVTHHGHYYLNLKERLSVDEIKQRIRLGETTVY